MFMSMVMDRVLGYVHVQLAQTARPACETLHAQYLMSHIKPIDVQKIDGEFCVRCQGDVLVCSWHRVWNKVVQNPYGCTGWATLVRSLNSQFEENRVVRTVAHAVLCYLKASPLPLAPFLCPSG